MILCENNVNYSYLIPILDSISTKDLELVFVRSDEMQDINKNTRNINETTDVLSFPCDNTYIDSNLLGSIVINLDLAEQKALEYSHSKEDEISLLFIHGLLHLLGFDHEIDNGEMREAEEKIIKDFNLPKSLIVRTLD